MDTLLTFLTYSMLVGLLFSLPLLILVGISLNLLVILFVIVSLISLATVLIIAPIILIPLLIVIPFLIVPLALYYLWRYYPHYIHWIKYHFFTKPYHLLKTYYLAPLRALPRQEINPNTHFLLLGGVFSMSLATVFLLYHVIQGGSLTAWNSPIYYAMRELRSPSFDAVWVKISLLNSLMMNFFWIIIATHFILKKDIWRFTHWLLLGLFIAVALVSLKYSTGIARPGAIFSIKDAFPSAHVAIHITLLGALLLLIDLQKTASWIKWPTYIAYGVWNYLIAFSRLYLAAHWLTDVVAAVLISLTALGLFSLSYYRRLPPPSARGELALVSLGALGSLWILRFVLEYDKILSFYMASF
jgi:membrane-associated phospholipid phosphatase